jgi:hypothetical protein
MEAGRRRSLAQGEQAGEALSYFGRTFVAEIADVSVQLP